MVAKFNRIEKEWELYLNGSLFCYLSNDDFDYLCENFSQPIKIMG